MTHRLHFALIGAAALLGSGLLPTVDVFADPSVNLSPAAANSATRPSTSQPDDNGAERARRRDGDHKAFLDAHIAALHAGLEFSTDQEKTWAPMERALRDLMSARHDLHAIRHDAETGPAHLKERGTRTVAMGQAMTALADASGPFVNTLTPDQRERLPRLTHGFPRRLMALALGMADERGDEGYHGRRDGREGPGRWNEDQSDRDGSAVHGNDDRMGRRDGWWRGGRGRHEHDESAPDEGSDDRG